MSQDSTLGAENELALERLRRALATMEGFQLLFLECPEGPERAHVLETLMSWSGTKGIPRLKHLRLSGRAAKLPPLATRNGGIVLEGLDSLLLDNDHVDHLIGTLNWQRDQLKTHIHGPLLLVLSGRGMARLLERAPDLASWRAHTCRITGLTPHQPARQLLEATRPDELELEHLEGLLERARSRTTPPRTLASLWLDVARARARSGDLDLARQAFEKARSIASDSPDLRCQADQHLGLLELQIGDLLEAQRVLERLQTYDPPLLRTAWLPLAVELAARRGNYVLAIELGRQLLEHSRADPQDHAAATILLSSTLAETGALDEACDLLERTSASAPPDARLLIHMVKAKLEKQRGRDDLSAEAGQKVWAIARRHVELRATALETCLGLVGPLLAAGRRAEARDILDLMEPVLPAAATPMLRGLATWLRGLLLQAERKPHQARAAFEAAVLWFAGTNAEPLARMMLATASPDAKARAELATALRLARKKGFSPVTEILERVVTAFEAANDVPSSPSRKPRRPTRRKPPQAPSRNALSLDAQRKRRGA